MMNNAGQARLMMAQYGLTPGSLLARLRSPQAPRIVANSIPKAGTNLLMRALYLHPPLRRSWQRTIVDNAADRLSTTLTRLRPGQFVVAHLKHSDACDRLITDKAIKHILMVRDPRAIAVSNAHYIFAMDRRHRLHRYFCSLPDQQARIQASLFGIRGELLDDGRESLPLARHIDGYLPWQDVDECLVVRFEDLVGRRGGGSEETQQIVLAQIYRFLGIGMREEEIRAIGQRLFSADSRTFRKGLVDGWRDGLSDRLIGQLNEALRDALDLFGYSD